MKIEDLLFEEESSTLDFKQEQYPFIKVNDEQKSELLKDILAFANAWRREDAYILIGVEEVKGDRSIVLGIGNDIDDASLQQFINGKTQKPLNFEYKYEIVDGKNIGIIRIPVNERPFYLKNDFGKLKKNIVYVRRGSSTAEATPDEIIKMAMSALEEKKIPSLKLFFANKGERKKLDSELNIVSNIIKLPNEEEIPDYESNNFIIGSSVNNNYYRELCSYHSIITMLSPISFCIENLSENLANDIKIEISMDGNIDCLLEDELPKKPLEMNNIYSNHQDIDFKLNQDIDIKLINNIWHIEVIFKKVQGKQILFTRDLFYLKILKEGQIVLNYKIYADELPFPIEDKLIINGEIKNGEKEINDLIPLFLP